MFPPRDKASDFFLLPKKQYSRYVILFPVMFLQEFPQGWKAWTRVSPFERQGFPPAGKSLPVLTTLSSRFSRGTMPALFEELLVGCLMKLRVSMPSALSIAI